MIKIDEQLKDIKFCTVAADGDSLELLTKPSPVLSVEGSFFVSDDATPIFDEKSDLIKSWSGDKFFIEDILYLVSPMENILDD